MLATWAIHLLKLKEISGLNMSIFQKVAEKKTHLEHDMQLLNNNTLYKTLRFQHLEKKKKQSGSLVWKKIQGCPACVKTQHIKYGWTKNKTSNLGYTKPIFEDSHIPRRI